MTCSNVPEFKFEGIFRCQKSSPGAYSYHKKKQSDQRLMDVSAA